MSETVLATQALVSEADARRARSRKSIIIGFTSFIVVFPIAAGTVEVTAALFLMTLFR